MSAGGEEALCRLLDEAPATTGVIAYNDLMAIGAMRAVRASGRTVPDDISVVGFDDIAISAYADPPLTTIAQAIGDLGRWAVERLVERIADGGTATTDDGRARPGLPATVLPVRLVMRGSSGARRGAGQPRSAGRSPRPQSTAVLLGPELGRLIRADRSDGVRGTVTVEASRHDRQGRDAVQAPVLDDQ